MSTAAASAIDQRPLLLFVAPYFPPAYYGGVVQIYLGLLERLPQFRVVVVTDRCGSTYSEQQVWDAKAAKMGTFTVERMDAFELHFRSSEVSGRRASWMCLPNRVQRALIFYSEGKRDWRQLLKRYKPDIVICGGTYSAGWLTYELPRHVLLINYIHGEELTMQVSPRLLMPQMRRLQMRSIRRAELNIAVSAYTARLIEALAGIQHSRVVVLPNFVDTKRFRVSGDRAALRAKQGWGDRLVLLTLARLDPRKGLDHALRALALLHQHSEIPSNWIYIVAGRGEQRSVLEELSRQLGIASHVTFLGFIPGDEVPSLYEASDIFLQPNREICGDTEGFGVVFLEAGACGLPVVGGIAGGTADAIEEGVSGYRVDAESIEEIADVLRLLCSDSDLRSRLGAQGAARVAAHFTVEMAAIRFSQLLRTSLEEHRARVATDLST